MSQLRNNSPVQHFLRLLCLLVLWHAGPSLAERADRNKPLHLEANSVSVDEAKQTSSFEGNVQLLQGTLSIEADKILVVQDKDGFQHCTASGRPAHFRQKRDGVNEYVDAYGERIEYDTHNEVTEFFGQARIRRAGDDVRGEHIVYNTRTEVFQVSGAQAKSADKPGAGRVTIVIQPQARPADGAASGVANGSAPLSMKPATTITDPKH